MTPVCYFRGSGFRTRVAAEDSLLESVAAGELDYREILDARITRYEDVSGRRHWRVDLVDRLLAEYMHV